MSSVDIEPSSFYLVMRREIPRHMRKHLGENATENFVLAMHKLMSINRLSVNSEENKWWLYIARSGLLQGAQHTDVATSALMKALSLPVEMRQLLVDDLLKSGADPNEKIQVKNGKMPDLVPFIMAVQSGPVGVIKSFIRHGVDINITNNKGTTPLYAAIWSGEYECVKLLLMHGANIGAIKNGQDLLQTAIFVRNDHPHKVTSNALVDLVESHLKSHQDKKTIESSLCAPFKERAERKL